MPLCERYFPTTASQFGICGHGYGRCTRFAGECVVCKYGGGKFGGGNAKNVVYVKETNTPPNPKRGGQEAHSFWVNLDRTRAGIAKDPGKVTPTLSFAFGSSTETVSFSAGMANTSISSQSTLKNSSFKGVNHRVIPEINVPRKSTESFLPRQCLPIEDACRWHSKSKKGWTSEMCSWEVHHCYSGCYKTFVRM